MGVPSVYRDRGWDIYGMQGPYALANATATRSRVCYAVWSSVLSLLLLPVAPYHPLLQPLLLLSPQATITGVNNSEELTVAAKDATAAAAADPSLAAAAAAASDAPLVASVASVSSGVATASASIGAAAATLAATLPDLAPYRSLTAAAREVYERLPTPQSQVGGFHIPVCSQKPG